MALTFLYALLEGTSAPAQWRAFVGIGVLGGYTTFSTFSYEAVRLLQDAQWNRAIAYVLATVVGCLGAALLGFRAGATILTRG